MSNQIIMWLMLTVPWAATFLFMEKENIKRYMPAVLFNIVTNVIIVDIGITMKMWVSQENIYPLHGITFMCYATPAFLFWILKYTYGRFWLYAFTQFVSSVFHSFVLLPWLNNHGIWMWVNATSLLVWLPTTLHWISIYLFQMWQEGIFTHYTEKKSFSPSLQPAATKPLPKDRKDKGEE